MRSAPHPKGESEHGKPVEYSLNKDASWVGKKGSDIDPPNVYSRDDAAEAHPTDFPDTGNEKLPDIDMHTYCELAELLDRDSSRNSDHVNDLRSIMRFRFAPWILSCV